MKRVFGVIVTLLLATPVFAQDDLGGFLGGGGDAGFLIDVPTGGGGGARGGGGRGGAAGARGAAPQQPAVDRLVSLKDILSKAGAPVTPDQEKALNALLDKEIPAMQAGFRAKFATEVAAMEAAAAAAAAQRAAAAAAGGAPGGAPGAGGAGGGRGQGGGQGGGGGQRGGGGGAAGAPGAGGRGQGGGQDGGGGRGGQANGLTIPPDSPMALEVRRLNDELMNNLVASLQPNQTVVLQKMQDDQVRARGIYDFGALKLAMADAKAPAFTPEQTTQIQALYADRSQQRYTLAQASQGPADAAGLAKIDADTIKKLLAVMNTAQKSALATSMKPKPAQ